MNPDDKQLTEYFESKLRHDLPDHLRREEERLQELAGSLSTPNRLPGSIRSQVMKRVRGMRPSPWSAFWIWLTTAREVRITPLGGFAGAAVAAGLALILLTNVGEQTSPAPLAASTSISTRFMLLEPTASSVVVTGDWAHWSPEGVALERGPDGLWVGEVELEPGVHRYTFLVDGRRWVADPRALLTVDDGFGGRNSVIAITPPTSS